MSVTAYCQNGDHEACEGRITTVTSGEVVAWCSCGCHRVDSRKPTLEHITKVRSNLMRMVQDLQYRAADHDKSKLEEPEKALFDEWSPRLRQVEFGTPEYEEARASMGAALAHHYEHNDHHPEHFPDGIHGMNLLQLLEMLADWKAAVERHGDLSITLAESIERNAERFGYDNGMATMLLKTADYLGWL